VSLKPANPGSPGKVAVKTERESLWTQTSYFKFTKMQMEFILCH